MKKTWWLLAAASVAALTGLTACDDDSKSTPSATASEAASEEVSEAASASVEEPNPIEEEDGPAAIKTKLGLKLEADPAGVDPAYSIIDDTVAQVIYTGEIGGKTAEITVRLSKTASAEDISGDFTVYDTVEPGTVVGEVTPTVNFTDGAAGYVIWYDHTTGVSGSAAVSAGAGFDTLNQLAEYYINQGTQA